MKHLAMILLLATSNFGADFTACLPAGKADIKFAGLFAFGPDGVLWGDSLGFAVYAVDRQDRAPAAMPALIESGALELRTVALP
jgi:hypothetical protein